jgi:hypothetical protein
MALSDISQVRNDKVAFGVKRTSQISRISRQTFELGNQPREAALELQERHSEAMRSINQNQENANLRGLGVATVVSNLFGVGNDWALGKQVSEDLEKRRDQISAAHKSNQGVLVVIYVAREKDSQATFLARSYQGMTLVRGSTPDEALASYRYRTSVSPSLPRGAPFYPTEEYMWLDVNDPR